MEREAEKGEGRVKEIEWEDHFEKLSSFAISPSEKYFRLKSETFISSSYSLVSF